MTIRLSSRAGGGSKTPLGRIVNTSTAITAADLYSVTSVDTSSGAINLTMPSSPSINDTYCFLDAKANWGVNPVTLSSALYYGTTQTFTLDTSGGLILAVWRGAPTGWTIGTDNPTFDNTQLNTLMSLLATVANPNFTGVPNAPTAAFGTNSIQIATTAFVQAAAAVLAPLISPALTGTPTVPTAALGTSTTQAANTAFVANALSAYTGLVVNRTVTAATDAPTTADKGKVVALDTTANTVVVTLPSTGLTVGDQYSFLDAKANWGVTPASLASATFFGTVQTVALDTTGDMITATWRGLPIGWTVGAGSAFFDNTTLNNLFSLKAALASPTFSGIPAAPTPSTGTSTTQLATTAFVNNSITNYFGPAVTRTTALATDAPTTADRNLAVAVDTTTNATVITLPTTGQTVGDTYSFLDAKANWGVNPASFASATFFGTAQTVTLDTVGGVATAIWRGLPIGWTVGSGNAYFDNTTLNTLFSLKAALASPSFTGTPLAPTAAAGTNTTQVATTSFVNTAIAAYPGPAISRTTALATDTVTSADKSVVVAVDTTTNATVITLPTTGQVVGDKYSFLDAKNNWGVNPASFASATFFGTAQTVSLDSPGNLITATWRGLPIGWTISSGSATFDSTTLNTLFSVKAPIDTPTFTGIPAAPTAAVGTSTTQLATTAYVQGEVSAINGKSAMVATATGLSANTTLTSAYKGLLTPIDTSAGVVQITLPVSGNVLNDTYGFYDPKGTWSTNNVTFVVGTVHSQATTLVGDLSNVGVFLKYVNPTIGWIRV